MRLRRSFLFTRKSAQVAPPSYSLTLFLLDDFHYGISRTPLGFLDRDELPILGVTADLLTARLLLLMVFSFVV